MANSSGGDLVYGIDELDNGGLTLAPIAGESVDAATRRLGQVLDSGIEPRLVGVRMMEVRLREGYALIVRVAPSFNGPHRFNMNGHTKFVSRTGTHTSELSYEQLRAAFDRTATLSERARVFCANRLELISEGKSPIPLISGPVCVLQAVPVTSMSSDFAVDVAALYRGGFERFMRPGWGGASRSLNLDGLLVFPGARRDQGSVGYVQVFRTGALEAASYGGNFQNDRKLIPSTNVSMFYRQAIETSLHHFRRSGVVGPAVFSASLLNVGDYEFGVGSQIFHFDALTADRPSMVLPEHWTDNVETADVDAVARPILDILWQAFSVERCLEYAQDGTWRPTA